MFSNIEMIKNMLKFFFKSFKNNFKKGKNSCMKFQLIYKGIKLYHM